MNRTLKAAIICLAATLTLSGCGKQHKAEKTVKEFLDKNLTASDYSVSFTKIDSTRLVTDSIVNAMRKNAARNTSFKKGMTFDQGASQDVYIFTKAIIRIGNDTIRHTFYLTPDLTRVVSFKEN